MSTTETAVVAVVTKLTWVRLVELPEDWFAHPDTVLVVSPAPQPSQAQPGLVLSLPVGTYCRPMPSTLSSPLQLTPSLRCRW